MCQKRQGSSLLVFLVVAVFAAFRELFNFLQVAENPCTPRRSDSTTNTEGIQSRSTVDFPTSKATPLRPTWFVFRTENSMFISQQNNVRCSTLDHPIPSSQLLPLASHGFARGRMQLARMSSSRVRSSSLATYSQPPRAARLP